MSEAEIVLFTGVRVSPCQMALNLCAAFTEFPFGSPERAQPLRAVLEGAGRSHEPKLVWLLAHSGTRSDFEDLVYTLVDLNFLDEFYADDSALELLCWNFLERPSRALIDHERKLRIERERHMREQQRTLTENGLPDELLTDIEELEQVYWNMFEQPYRTGIKHEKKLQSGQK